MIGRVAPPRRRSWTGVICAASAGAVLAAVATLGFAAYGWLLFAATPFFMGWIVALFVADEGYPELRAAGYAVVAIVLCGLILLVVGLEGAICLFMALPLAAPLAGAAVGLVSRRSPGRHAPSGRPVALGVAVLALPGLLATDVQRTATSPLHRVETSIEVDEAPERVWPFVVSFAELPPPTEWIFRAGVAHPIRARIDGHGVGAVRYCEFSTGPFVEPITAWEAPHRLAFDVVQSPAPLAERNPFHRVQPPHLEGYLASERGEFRLEALPGGRTRLTGTTWYRHHMYPDRYWQAWSDFVIHRIHLRVLRHIATEATRWTGEGL